MDTKLIELAEKNSRKADVPHFSIGDTVDVHVRIVEGEKERVQVFNGTVIARKGSGLNENFTVRRIVNNEGVERIFPLHSPNVLDIVVKRSGQTRRAKLYYLRQRVGKSRRLRDRVSGLGSGGQPAPASPQVSEPEPQEADPAVETAEAKE